MTELTFSHKADLALAAAADLRGQGMETVAGAIEAMTATALDCTALLGPVAALHTRDECACWDQLDHQGELHRVISCARQILPEQPSDQAETFTWCDEDGAEMYGALVYLGFVEPNGAFRPGTCKVTNWKRMEALEWIEKRGPVGAYFITSSGRGKIMAGSFNGGKI